LEPQGATPSETSCSTPSTRRSATSACDSEGRRILLGNRDKLDATVEQLLAQETLDEPEVYAAGSPDRSDPLRV
jgi:ATP-dependent Zn protease